MAPTGGHLVRDDVHDGETASKFTLEYKDEAPLAGQDPCWRPAEGPNQVWQLDFLRVETTTGGTWRLAGCRDYWSRYEHRFHVSPTANQRDAIDAIELALADYEAVFAPPARR